MKAAAFLFLLLLGFAPAAGAQDPASPAAESAADALREAIDSLEQAEGSRDRVAALTHTVRAYEAGLAGLRDALRRALAREAEIIAELDGQRDRIGQVLGAMAVLQRIGEPVILLHPDGPLETARAGMILAATTPALEAEATALQEQIDEIRRLRALQGETTAMLQKGLTAAQDARTALSKAIQDRTDLPRRFLEDPEELTALLASADSLDAFAKGLADMETDIGAPMEDFEGAKGTLPLPVQGRLLRRAGQADAAGIVRPGLLFATEPAALVTLPWPATIRYRGPLLDYGNVMIAEPASGYLLVFAGLATVYGETGDVLDAGAPIGLMGGDMGMGTANTGQTEEGGGAGRAETLYIELRQGEAPVDPAPWFTETRDD
ncbi:MAG: peptidase M23 [Albidovulum sp.]|uniref:murein hydrolase activator EnvC family protein n=1 Tax=Albidovulum sp. TaxID=1872424 RepID=UPI003CB9A159